MGDVGDDFRAMREEGQRNRSRNRSNSPKLLESHGIAFTSKNGGAHLIVEGYNGLIDYWPGTGRFIPRSNGKKLFGVRRLIRMIEGEVI